MNRKVLALAVAGAFAGVAHAQTNVQIYGIVDAGVSHVTKVAAATAANPTGTGSRTGIDSGLRQASRFGFRGKEDLGNGLDAIFALEGGIAIDNGTSTQGGALFGRKSIVGLAGKNFGDLELGRRKDFIDEVSGPFSSIAPFGTFVTKVHANNLDRVGGNRSNNIIYYSTPKFNGFQANVTYGFGEAAGDNSAGSGFGVGAKYLNGPFGIGFGYWQSKRGVTATSSADQGAPSGAGCKTTNIGNAGDTCIKTWMLGSSYKFGNMTVRGTYSKVEQPLITAAGAAAPAFATTFTSTAGTGAFAAGGSNNSEANIVDVGLDYYVGNWKLMTSLIQSRYKFVGATDDGRLTQGLIGFQYDMSKRTALYGTAAHMTASNMYSPGIIGGAPGADNSTTAFGVGIRHKF